MRSKFIRSAGLSATELIALFSIKILVGLVLGWISYLTGPTETDYTTMNHFGRLEYKMMIEDPKLFFSDIFRSNYGDDYGGLFSSHNSYWNDLKNNILIKMLAFMNILSRGNYYINSLFFNFLCFFGHIALYRAFTKIHPGQKWLLIIACFLLPSTLYFSSGINKDNVSFTLVGLIVLGLYKWFYEKLTDFQKLLIITGFIFLFLIRTHTAIAMIPGVFAWWLMVKTKFPAWRIAVLVPLGLLVLSFITDLAAPTLSPLKPMMAKQEDFVQMQANTEIEPVELQPSTLSLLAGTPEALERTILRPYVWESSTSPFLLMLSLETTVYTLLIIAGIVLIFLHKRKFHPMTWFGFIFSVAALVIIGIIVPHIGAIIRYRALFYPFILLPFIIEAGNLAMKYIRNKNI